MRGGLGKTLLVAFLLLTIVPLSLLAFLTYNQIQQDTGRKLVASLEAMAALKEAYLVDRIEGYERELTLLASKLEESGNLTAELETLLGLDPALTELVLVDGKTGAVLARSGISGQESRVFESLGTAGQGLVMMAGDRPMLAVRHSWDDRQLVGLVGWDALREIIVDHDLPDGGATSLVLEGGWVLSTEGLNLLSPGGEEADSEGIAHLLQGEIGSGAYVNQVGVPVYGAYRWNPELGVGILAEESQSRAQAAGNALTALIVGMTLAVALVTSALAAVVTRRVTRPIVQLTEKAAWMARGDLDQRVMISRTDEIGVLARAFNRMAAELRVLYDNLEAKVAERTQQLEAANEQTQVYLIQLATSAEVARVATSIRDLDVLLATVVTLIDQSFELLHTSIYLLNEGGEWATVVASRDQSGGEDSRSVPVPDRVKGEGRAVIDRVVTDGRRRVVRAVPHSNGQGGSEQEKQLQPAVVCEMAVPLKVKDRVLGVLLLQSGRVDDFYDGQQVVYQSLSDQISIAIENARAYTAERETVERLRELDRIQSQFLTNMSHALRTPLNTIIGFSRVLLKELDGPLNEVQRDDLDAIYDSGRQLLGLINDMLELSHLELGVAPFAPSDVDLAETISGVMATARALARGKAVQLYEEVPSDLPAVYTDGQRVRQVILALLTNAVKFTADGSIYLRVAVDDGQVTISVRDTGVGMPREERERILADVLPDEAESGQTRPGFGLAISKRVVERLGGRIWVDSVEGSGSTFSFTLPIGRPGDQGTS
jgi:signal transduction histidine kinase